jgi:hypothetical protein
MVGPNPGFEGGSAGDQEIFHRLNQIGHFFGGTTMKAAALALLILTILVSPTLSENRLNPKVNEWIDIASGTSLEGAGATAGAAWGDCDGDGLEDLYLSQFDLPNQLFHNEGNGVFTEMTGAPVNDAGGGTCAYWGDHDNDGQLDLYALRLMQSNLLFLNDAGCTFLDVTSAPLDDAGEVWGAAWVDYDLDGLLDIYISNVDGPNVLARNDGGGNFSVVAGVLDYAGASEAAAWADYDNDGDQDLFLVSGTGSPNLLHRNEGGGTFTDVTTPVLANGGGGQGAAWGDYDNDGDLDLFVTTWNSLNKLFRNDGGDAFTDVTDGALHGYPFGQSATWGDYDNDGDLDLYVAYYGLDNTLLENLGGGVFYETELLYPILADPAQSVGAAWSDCDNDGDLDLYVSNFGSSSRLFANNLDNGNRWLHVKCVGTLSNRSAIGARVRVVAGGQAWIREINGGSGYMSQNSLTAEFGLGSASRVDTVEVTWPHDDGSGQFVTSVRTDVSVDRVLTMYEPGGSPSGVGDVQPAGYRLYANYPNPFNPATEISFAVPDGGANVSLRIFDISGRLIRTLVHGHEPGGTRTVTWQGKDDQGQPAASGTYFYQLSAPSFSEMKKMVLLK